MNLVEMIWLGGPMDGDILVVSENHVRGPIRVIYGTVGQQSECHVTPVHMSDGRWILPFHEGTPIKETR